MEPTLNSIPESNSIASRRSFLKSTTVVTAAAVASQAIVAPAVHSQEPAKDLQPLRIALVGAGGRGAGAVDDSLSINEGIELVAIADMDAKVAASVRDAMSKRHPGKVNVADEHLYEGMDSYKRILDDKSIDVVLMATPPGFRPRYVRDAVDAGKHVFAEKPSCVDPAGFKICVETHKKAEANGTAIVTGTQYRRQTSFIEAIKRIQDGAIGDIVAATSRYCANGIWYRPRRDGMSDTEYQIHNWMHFVWLSGDQIAEQAVHNIDAMNWLMGGPPESAYGCGGRFTRPDDSEMWDNMHIDFMYPGNRLLSFKCQQIPGSESSNGSIVYGTNGSATIGSFSNPCEIRDKTGNVVFEIKGDISAAYKQEHKDLIDSIRAGKPIVEFIQTAESSLTAVMGRMAAYTAKKVTWEFLTGESKLDTYPPELTQSSELPKPAHAVPGKTKLV